MRIIWGLTLLLSGYLTFEGLLTYAKAISAPQQATAAALICASAIVPYVWARCIQGIIGVAKVEVMNTPAQPTQDKPVSDAVETPGE